MPTIIARTSYGLPAIVKNFDRITNRPRLAKNLGLVVCHHTGVNRAYHALDAAQVIPQINGWKNNEYNHVIDHEGRIFELAGEYQAAHARGLNHMSYGVLFLNGTEEPCTDAQVEAFKWLMGVHRWVQNVLPTVIVAGHGEVAATACPGRVRERMAELRIWP